MEKELNTRCEMMVGHIIENTNTEMHGYGVFFHRKVDYWKTLYRNNISSASEHAVILGSAPLS